eukprot:Transcript_28217.p1 GENE.Transcript_28217~~Transcript_28217.p1  ORF type:complete len:304 (+),score=83.31 Transcript_28217:300-1211(+)
MRRPSLHGAGEFVSATWEMINGGFADCGWSADGTEIVVYNPERLAENVLPRFFRHTQYSSWVRTLNHYSFRKTRPGQWINPNFQRGKPELLHIITRKVAPVRPLPSSNMHERHAAVQATRQRLELQQANVQWMRQEMRRLETELQGVQAEGAWLVSFEARLRNLLLSDAKRCKCNLDRRQSPEAAGFAAPIGLWLRDTAAADDGDEGSHQSSERDFGVCGGASFSGGHRAAAATMAAAAAKEQRAAELETSGGDASATPPMSWGDDSDRRLPAPPGERGSARAHASTSPRHAAPLRASHACTA